MHARFSQGVVLDNIIIVFYDFQLCIATGTSGLQYAPLSLHVLKPTVRAGTLGLQYAPLGFHLLKSLLYAPFKTYL